MKRVVGLAVLILALSAGLVRAQVVVTYDTTIVRVLPGEDFEYFPVGERVVISYVLDADPDRDPDPTRGIYGRAVVAMWVSFPDLGLYANCGGPLYGTAMTANNALNLTGWHDSAGFGCGTVTESSPIGGDPVTEVSVGFQEERDRSVEPTLFSSDALPLYPISAEYTLMRIQTTGFVTTLIELSTLLTPVTVTYDAIVESASGPHAALFPAGERTQLTYTLGRRATDRNADASTGIYRNALLNFNVTFPNLGIFVNAGPPRRPPEGQVFTFNDVVLGSGAPADQISIFASPLATSSLLGGEPISSLLLSFYDFPVAPAVSRMLSTGTLPLYRLRASDSYLQFESASGDTFVNFVLAPSTQVEMLTDNINSLVAGGTIAADVADRLLRSLESAAASIAKNNTGSACSHLRAFVRRVEDEIDAGTLPAGSGQALIDHAETLQNQLGCS